MINRGYVVTNIICVLDNVPDIAEREDSGGPRPVASWSHGKNKNSLFRHNNKYIHILTK